MFIFSYSYFYSKKKHEKLGLVFTIIFAGVCLYFGINVSFHDFIVGKQIICFLTMALYAGCLLIWKPYVSFLLLGAVFEGFYLLLRYRSGVEILSGDKVNYAIFFISLTMLFISIYQQRMKEAEKDEELERIAKEDDLTGLLNRRYFTERINELLDEGEIDIDNKIYLALKVGGYRPSSKEERSRHSLDHARYACGLIKNKYDVNYMEYDEATELEFRKRQYVVNHIDKAVENGYIQVYYQPVVWSKNSDLCGCEALARWIDPTYGFLSPGYFIPLLEECRQIHKLDMCIYESVCRDLRKSMDEGRPVVPVSLNFSRLDFELIDAVELLEGLVEKYQVPRNYLHVEITESAMTDDLGELRRAMEKFHELGYSIWLDDFGSGYSSLNTLKDYSFDVMKIDMKFLVNFSGNAKSKEILDCIIQLADRIGMKTLTEGVETEEVAEYLKSIGCGRLQGYLFGKPMSYDQLHEELANGKYRVSEEVL